MNELSETNLLSNIAEYPLHLLGWKAFQDLCLSIAEECLRRPVQSFLPGSDAGRDGAFIGRWEGDDPVAGESTIQCKFTSQKKVNLTLSMLDEELDKAALLAEKGLALDYIILTNHPITGASELKIKEAFKARGVGRCRIFGHDWIVRQILCSPRLRMMVPRLYGLGDLSELLDARAYAQAQLILSAMGNDIQKLVVTEAHKKSVKAISEYNLVLLLGAPATGKSTIGASLAVGATDIWQCGTIRATCPEDIKRHLSPNVSQFFWIDDAWGNTQYQRHTVEEWNQIFPLMQGAMKKGTRFLITSRDYIWRAAKSDLKLQALPVLSQSQVIINVEELTLQEKAQILYNHIKMGDQPTEFRRAIKPFLPELAEQKGFLPETARRLSLTFFTGKLNPSREQLIAFFEQPQGFLLDTISNLAPDCLSAISSVFMNGGQVRSPLIPQVLEPAANAFGVHASLIRGQLDALNTSLLLLMQDETGPYWTYKHPTVSDAFASYVAKRPELIEVYLKGAKQESIYREVVCAGATFPGTQVIVHNELHELLAERLKNLSVYLLRSFLSYRSNKQFMMLMLELRPDILDLLESFSSPFKDDPDVQLLVCLHKQGLLSEEVRQNFVEEVHLAATDYVDASFLERDEIGELLTEDEKNSILDDVEQSVLERLEYHIGTLKSDWTNEYSPSDYFEDFENSVELFIESLKYKNDYSGLIPFMKEKISDAIAEMWEDHEPASSTSAPISSSPPRSTPLINLFRDVDE